MTQRIRKSGSWLVAAVTMGIMAFGAQRLLASTAAMECANDGINFLGQQPSQQACYNACYAVHGEELAWEVWHPTTGCCGCVY